MKPPTYRAPHPQHTSTALVREMQSDRATAKSAPFTAACWLTFLAAILPLVPLRGMRIGIASAEIFALIMVVLAIVLFVRAAVMRGIVTILFAGLGTLWLHGGAIFAVIALHDAGIDMPWIVLP